MTRAHGRHAALTFAAFLALCSSSHIARGETPAPAAPPAPVPAPFSLPAPPWLGVTMDGGGDIGVKIEHVVRGSPADRAGVRAGDRIVAIDGARVIAPGQVTRAIGAHKVGDTASVELDRRGSAITASVVLASRPSGDEILKMDLVGAPAPAWQNVSPLAGGPSSIASLKGRVVIVDFWATWCGPCRMLAPRLSALKDKLGVQGLSVVGITTDEAEKAAVFAEKHQMRYGIVIDKDGDTSRAYGITGLPTMLLVDKRGVVRDVFVGFDPSGELRLEARVKALLAESGPTPAAPPAGAAPREPSAPRPPGR